jgi:hypothetical protein
MRGFGGFVTFNYISVIFQRVTVKHGGETRTGLYGGTVVHHGFSTSNCYILNGMFTLTNRNILI